MIAASPPLKDFLDAEFRANPDYELVLFDRLPLERQTTLVGLKSDPLFYGILQPRGPSDLTIKAVCQETALLFLTLQTAGPIPAYLRASLGVDCQRTIAQLVLDAVLGIADGQGFVTRSAASALLFTAGAPSEHGQGRLARLSIDALRYGQDLEMDDPGKLSARLYFFNRLPATPAWLRRFPDSAAVARHLKLTERGACHQALLHGWREMSTNVQNAGWRMWVQTRGLGSGDRSSSNYKLYVSPRCKEAPEALAATVDTLSRMPQGSFKIGSDVYGLLRPDKIIAYFANFEQLEEAAQKLHARLQGCPVQGVPFSAELTGDGLLSWGTDPPRAQRTPGYQEQESWRLWLSNRLALALMGARNSPCGANAIEPWRFALERMALEGVDTATWTPRPDIWSDPLKSTDAYADY